MTSDVPGREFGATLATTMRMCRSLIVHRNVHPVTRRHGTRVTVIPYGDCHSEERGIFSPHCRSCTEAADPGWDRPLRHVAVPVARNPAVVCIWQAGRGRLLGLPHGAGGKVQ